jgi:hypothetical protein
MAIHEKLRTMAMEAIDEYLQASKLCLERRKPDNGCLGYPSTLLLFCVVNALGTYLVGDSIEIEKRLQKITRGEPFRVLNHVCFGLTLSNKEIRLLKHSYRNALAHSAIIEYGTSLLPSDEDPPFTFESGLVEIRVFSFYRCVWRAWERFPKDRLQAWENKR